MIAALLAFAVPSLASAASTTLMFTDPGPSGLGATITIDDMLDPGNLSLTVSLTSSGGAVGDLRGVIILDIQNDALYPGLVAIGPDVFSGQIWGSSKDREDACACGLIADLGSEGLLEPTGLQTTTFVLDHPTVALTLADLNGQMFWVALGREPTDDDSARYGNQTPPSVLKLKSGPIQVIPEPTTAILMLLGLVGLSFSSRRLGAPPA